MKYYTACSGRGPDDGMADVVLREAGIIQSAAFWTFAETEVPQALAVLRFHGFEVEVEK